MSYVTDIFKDIKFELIMLYIATFIMRFAAYLSIALISYMVLDLVTRGFVIAFYSIVEILTVSFFGVWSDSRGRKGVLIASHVITTLGVFLFMIVGAILGKVPEGQNLDITVILFVFFPIMGVLGTGAAAKVASTMTMIADESTIENRAQYMGFFDLATLGGFAVGLAAGHIMTLVLNLSLVVSFSTAIITVVISVIMVYFLVDETLTTDEIANAEKISLAQSSTRVIHVIKENKDLQKLLPVYIPMISLYGLLVAFAKDLVEKELSAGLSIHLIVVVGIIGVFTGSSMLVMGKLSDTRRVRRPFIIVGLFALAILLTLFKIVSFEGLYYWFPVTMILSWGVGMFPPAILAYLTDISKKDTRGTMFGVYSVIFGSGMIIGPILGGFFGDLGKQFYGADLGETIGLVFTVLLFVVLSSLGTLFLQEKAKEESIPTVA